MIVSKALSQKDTTTNNSPICFPRYVVVGIQKDLIRLDHCDSIISYQDSIIINREVKITYQDSIIQADSIKIDNYKSNIKDYKSIINNKDQIIGIKESENKKLKKHRIGAIGVGILIAILGFII